MRNFLQSSNPALTRGAFAEAHNPYAYDEGVTRADVAATGTTVQGVVNKTALLVIVAVLAGAGGYGLIRGPMAGLAPGMLGLVVFGGVIATLGLAFVIFGNPQRAKGLAPVYAVIEGAVLGVITGVLDVMLESMQIAVAGGSLALQAFVITISIMLAMLALYYTRLLRPTRTFVAVVSTLTLGIMFTYALSWVLWFFGIQMPFITVGSALQGGTPALIGLGLNVLILGVASMWLIIDFKVIEDAVNEGAPRHMEWYCAFALLVSLAWIYYEAVKLAFRVAILLAGRE